MGSVNVLVDGGPRYDGLVNTLKAKVINGRLVVDEPTDFPEGTVLELVVADTEDELDDEERHAVHEALSAAWESAKAGNVRPVEEFVEEWRRSR